MPRPAPQGRHMRRRDKKKRQSSKNATRQDVQASRCAKDCTTSQFCRQCQRNRRRAARPRARRGIGTAGSQADMTVCGNRFCGRCWGLSGHGVLRRECRLLTQSGLQMSAYHPASPACSLRAPCFRYGRRSHVLRDRSGRHVSTGGVLYRSYPARRKTC